MSGGFWDGYKDFEEGYFVWGVFLDVLLFGCWCCVIFCVYNFFILIGNILFYVYIYYYFVSFCIVFDVEGFERKGV